MTDFWFSLNSLTDAQAKTGSFPFTTIDPNKATGYLQVECACNRLDKKGKCKPNYGWCDDGKRYVPIMLLDVAGLVPGAHLGRGLGNKFLDDLRHADALIHVVDVSGTTDAEGKATRGYDPLQDIEWLQDEIFRWILGNLTERWGSIKRRHTATKSSIIDTLQNQFSGYGSTADTVARALDSIKEPIGPLEAWTNDEISIVVKAFMAEKFPTVLSLNKIDHPDADKNISKIVRKYPDTKAVLTSALTEVFLRKLEKQGYIKYEPGTEFIDTYQDLGEDSGLKPMEEKLSENIERIRDSVLYRFGSTGLVEILKKSAEVLQLVPVFPVKNNASKTEFRDCVLLRAGTTVGSAARKIMGDVPIAAIEGPGGSKIAESDEIRIGHNDILTFKVGR